MSIPNKRDFEQLKTKIPVISFLMRYLPDGKRKGKEYVALNPMRADGNLGSFSVNVDTGIWSDFAIDQSGDLIDLYAYLHRCDTAKAYDDLSQIYFNAIPISKPKEPEEDPGIVIYPAPDDAGIPEADNRAMEFCYKNEFGQTLLYVFRYNHPNGSKRLTPPCTYRQFKDGSKRWHKKGIDDHPKPLYHIPELLKRSQARVILVEGEKAAEAAQRLMPDWVATCWHGGSNAANLVDYSYLKDRDVILWPDNDEPGFKAMKVALSKLKPIAKSVRCIDIRYLETKSPTWDLADGEAEGITYDDIMELINMSEEKLELSAFPMLSETGKPLNMPENVLHLANHYKITIRFNEITKKIDAFFPNTSFSTTNKEQLVLIEFKRLCVMHNVPRVDLPSWLLFLADKQRFNPVKEWIQSKPWDGISRFIEFANTLQTSNDILRDILLKRWMIGAITVAYNEKGKALHGVLTLLGKGSIGKSSWIKKLIPQDLDLMVRDFSLNPSDKDSVMQATSNWLTELSEVDAMVRKSDVASVKSFLTRDVDVYRAPYAAAETRAPRRTAFLASVNDDKFLRDTTGNRRWWVIEAKSIDYRHEIDMQQVWSEIEHYYNQGELGYLSKEEEEVLNLSNEEYLSCEPIEDKLEINFDWNSKKIHSMTCTAILEFMGYLNPPKSECNTLAALLKKKNVVKDDNKRRHYLMPDKKLSPLYSSDWGKR